MPETLPPDYVIDLGWPWTSDKMYISCPVCGMGAFKKIDDPRTVVHEGCSRSVKEENHA